MSGTTRIRYGDTYVSVSPEWPLQLEKALTYKHKSLTTDPEAEGAGKYRRKATLETAKLYVEDTSGGIPELLTMPGFASLVKAKMAGQGFKVEHVDERSEMPRPVGVLAASALLRPYQLDCLTAAAWSRGGIISCPTGYGKTHVMAALAATFPRGELLRARMAPLTVVVAPTKDIADKNWADFKEILPGRDIGLTHSSKKVESGDIVVCVAASLDNVPLEECGLLIYDEVHTLTRNKALAALRAGKALRYGFSATPTGRYDNADIVVEGVFGPVVYACDYQTAVGHGAIVPLEVLWLEAPEPAWWCKGEFDKVKAYRRGVWRNQPYNELVARVVGRAPANSQVLCVVDKIAHMDNLLPLMPGAVAVHAETSQKNLSDRGNNNTPAVSFKQRAQIYDDIKHGRTTRVVSTGIYRAGVSFPGLSVLVNAEGMGSEIIAGQLPGRASRTSAGKEKAWIVDFRRSWDLDNRGNPGLLLRDDMAREAVYKKIGFNQKKVREDELFT
jgi:superfamily II DNA or RNA helicase